MLLITVSSKDEISCSYYISRKNTSIRFNSFSNTFQIKEKSIKLQKKRESKHKLIYSHQSLHRATSFPKESKNHGQNPHTPPKRQRAKVRTAPPASNVYIEYLSAGESPKGWVAQFLKRRAAERKEKAEENRWIERARRRHTPPRAGAVARRSAQKNDRTRERRAQDRTDGAGGNNEARPPEKVR